MIEDREHLLPYVKARAEAIIREKDGAGIVPALATEIEIVRDIRADVLWCMKALGLQRRLRCVDTIGGPALMEAQEKTHQRKDK